MTSTRKKSITNRGPVRTRTIRKKRGCPQILIEVLGGMVEEVFATSPVKVSLLDHDVCEDPCREEADPDPLLWHGADATVLSPRMFKRKLRERE